MSKNIMVDATSPDKTTEVHALQQQTKERLYYQQPIYRGHKLYEVDIDEQSIRIMPIENIAVYNPNGFNSISTQNKVVTKPNCLYISCLNLKNLKRLIDGAGGKYISHYIYNSPDGAATPLHTLIKA